MQYSSRVDWLGMAGMYEKSRFLTIISTNLLHTAYKEVEHYLRLPTATLIYSVISLATLDMYLQ
jgi:hypothetical protein